jgi:4-hydroxybenzoate polyprenyltransferase/chlorophyll synthase
MFQLRFWAAALLAIGHSGQWLAGQLFLGAAGWLCAIWHVYLLNGVHDQTEDRRNGSARPLAAMQLPVSAARGIAQWLLVVSLVAGFATTWWQGALTAVMLALGWLYSAAPRPQKAVVPGAMAVITLGGAVTYLAGWCAAGGGAPTLELVVLAVSMSLWMGLVGLTKDLSDVPGDRVAGRRTLPILVGDGCARRVLAVHALGVGALGLILAWYCAPRLVPAAAVLMCGAAVLAAAVLSRFSRGSRGRRRQPYRIFGITQYTMHLVALTCWLSELLVV